MDENTRAADGLRFGCPGCGSGLRYDIRSRQMHCDNCGRDLPVEDVPDPSAHAEDGMMEAAEYRCPQCGAAVHTSQTAATSFCSYCGADVILTQKLTRTARPAGIVPFQITREECEKIYRRRVAEAKFAPPEFSEQKTIDHFRPVYIPYWRYRGGAQAVDMVGSATNHHSDSHYSYTDRYSYSINGDIRVDGILYDASVSFEDETARQLAFTTAKATAFHPAYLCGFYAEAPDTDPHLYSEGVRDYANSAWRKEFDRQCPYSVNKLQFPDGSFEVNADLTLMPVWLLAHRSGGRVVYTAINGDNGEIVCETPVSNRRFAMLAGALTALLLAALLLLSSMLILRPRLLAALCGVTAAVAQWIIARVSRDIRIRRNRENDLTWQMAQNGGKRVRINSVEKDPGPGTGWQIPLLIAGGIAGAAAVFSYMGAYNYNAFLASMLSDRSWLPGLLLAVSLGLFLLSRYSRQNRLDDLLYLLRFASVGVSLAALFLTDADVWFYLCCFAELGLTALSMARINLAHNEFVSRPVPFFGEEGEQA